MTGLGQPSGSDWYPGDVPRNVVVDPTAYIGSTYSFARFRSERPVGTTIGRAASIHGSVLDVGPAGELTIDEYVMVGECYILCDLEVKIGAYSLIAWNVVLMDNHRTRAEFRPPANSRNNQIPHDDSNSDIRSRARPILVGQNVWIGCEACVLPGVSIGDGSIVGARCVVTHDVPPFVAVAGNPARIIRHLPQADWKKDIALLR